MCDLFLAGFNRLWRSRVFQICCLVSFAANVFVMLATYRQVLNYTELGLEQSITLDSVFYGLVPVLGVMCAVFVSLFIGTEHSDGVMRNMLVVGRARWEIYLANYAVCFVGTAAFLVCWFLGGLVGIPLIGVCCWAAPCCCCARRPLRASSAFSPCSARTGQWRRCLRCCWQWGC